MPVEDLYQALILDHSRRPRNFGPLADADREVSGRNPLCGDEVTLRLRMDGDTIADVRFEGSGCAISKASASVMTAAVKGHTGEEALVLFDRFHDLLTNQHTAHDAEHTAHGTGDTPLPSSLAAFAGVARFPIRVKCASLAWHALRSALQSPTPTATAEAPPPGR